MSSRVTEQDRRSVLPKQLREQSVIVAGGNGDSATRHANQLAALFRYETPFWLLMLFWSFCPATKTPWVRCFGLPLDTKDVALVAGAIGYGLLAFLHRRQRVERDRSDYRHLPLFFTILLFYAWCSMLWNGTDPVHQPGVFWTLVMTQASCALPWALLTKLSPAETRGFLIRLTLFLAFVSLVYGSESVLSLGLRQSQLATSFGISRMFGPLFNAATGYFILLPALGWGLQEWLSGARREGHVIRLLVVFLLTAGIMALGSRGGMISLVIFLVLAVLFLRGAGKVHAVLLLVLFAAGGAGILVMADADFDRVAGMDDSARQTTHETAWKIITHSSLPTVLCGAGYGAYWPWYSRCGWTAESCEELPEHYIPRYIETDYGPILFNPHSELLLLTMELGLPGLMFFISLWSVLIGLPVRHGKDRCAGLLCCALAASGMALFFAGPLFATVRTSSVWWFYLLGAMRIMDSGGPRRGQTILGDWLRAGNAKTPTRCRLSVGPGVPFKGSAGDSAHAGDERPQRLEEHGSGAGGQVHERS